MKKRLPGYLLLLFLTACTTAPDGPRRVPLDEEPTPIATAVVIAKPTYTVERGEIIYQIDFSGRVGPAVEQILAFAQDGEVLQVYAQRGDEVKAGDLLAELDTQAIQETLLTAQAERDIAQNRLEALQTQQTIDRQRAELNRDLAQVYLDYAVQQGGQNPTPAQQLEISRRTIELQLAQLAVDSLASELDPLIEADLAEANLRLEALTESLNHTQLVAPSDGQITSLSLAPGQRVVAGNRVGLLADITLVEVQATLVESELAEMAEEMTATISVADQPGTIFPAFVRRLPPPYGSVGNNQDVAEDDRSTRVAFVNPADAAQFAPGDRVRVTIFLEQREDALWLPPAALREFNGRRFVVIQEGQAERRVDVIVGIEGNGRVEIVSGVEQGQTIIGP